MMTKTQFVANMVRIYGVYSCFNNIDEDNSIEDEGLWFECPECGEPILIDDDWDFEEVIAACPICGFEWENEIKNG